jgi:hypothetical protein
MMPKTQTTLYDGFTTPELDPSKWTIASFPSGDGNFWRWEEPQAKIKTGDGRLEIAVNPYTRFHDQIQIFDNPKHLYLGTQSFAVPEQGMISFSCQMGAVTHNGNPDDFKDGFASFNVLDFASGLVFDFIATSAKVGIIYERLLMPGLTTPKEAFTEIVEVGPNEPGQLSACRLDYNFEQNRVDYWFNGNKVVSRLDLPARPRNLFMGMGLITLRMIQNGRSTSLKGQGGTGLWSKIKVTTI